MAVTEHYNPARAYTGFMAGADELELVADQIDLVHAVVDLRELGAKAPWRVEDAERATELRNRITFLAGSISGRIARLRGR